MYLQAVQLSLLFQAFPERPRPKFQEYIDLCLQLKLHAQQVFTFKFVLSKSKAVLSMAADFPTLLKGVMESPIFIPLPSSLCVLF